MNNNCDMCGQPLDSLLLEQLKQLKEENDQKDGRIHDLELGYDCVKAASDIMEEDNSRLREREKELVGVLRELNSYAPDFTEYPNSLSTFDLGLQAASKKAESLLSKVKQTKD